MSNTYSLLFVLLFFVSCSSEKEMLIAGKAPANPMVGNYTFELTVEYGSITPDIDSYIPPKRFITDIMRSEKQKEISLLNIHDTGMCIYAKYNGSSIEIPMQDLELMPEAFGFKMSPDYPEATVFIQGTGSLTETTRSTDATIVGEMDIEYKIIYLGEIIWNISGNAVRELLPEDIETTCN
jgi:hypothetical protein